MADTKRRTGTRKAMAKEVAYGVPDSDTVAAKDTESATQPVSVSQQTPVNMVVEQKAPPVKILYIDSAIPNNQIPIGNGRYITGSGRIFSVSLEQFEGEFMTPLVMKLIDCRKFIVLSGLTEEQRE